MSDADAATLESSIDRRQPDRLRSPKGRAARMRRVGIDSPLPDTRSAVTNGARLFVEGQNGNSPWYRRYKDLVVEFTRDVGGDPSEAQRQIIRRCAALGVWLEAQEVQMAGGEGEAVEIGPYTTACNSLRRLLVDLGLERRTKPVEINLSAYVKGKSKPASDAAEDEAP